MAFTKPFNGIKRKSGYNLPGSLSPLDLCTVFYILFSTFLMCLGAPYLEGMFPHFAIRIAVLAGIYIMIRLDQKYNHEIVTFLRNIYPLLFINYFYAETSYLKNIIIAENLDESICRYEQNIFNCQPSIEFSKVFSQGWVNELMNIFYFSYYLLIISVSVAVYFKTRQHAARSIFIVVFSFYLYYIVFALVPVTGPQYFFSEADAQIQRPYFFGKLMHFILTNAEEPTGAFPSSHVGIAVILCYIAFKHLKTVFYIALPFVVGICFATVYLKAHYLLDVVAGLISAPLFYVISNFLYAKLTGNGATKSAQQA